MKQILLFFICVVMMFSVSSCGKQTDHLYEVKINAEGHSPDLEKYARFSLEQQVYTDETVSAQREFCFLDQDLTLHYQNSREKTMMNEGVNCYVSSDGRSKFEFSSEDGRLVCGDVSISCPVPLSSETEYRAWFEPIITELTGEDLSRYHYSSKTRLSLSSSSGNAHWTKTEDGILLEPHNENADEKEEITSYYINYNIYIDNYRTLDCIQLIIEPNGDISSICHKRCGLDETTSVEIDEEKLAVTVEQTVKDLYAEYKVKDFSVQDKSLTNYNGKTYLILGVTIQTDLFGEPILMAVDVSFK